MADDKNKNEDPEENDDLFDDDEDFGLPDLDYDDLDDEFDDGLLEEEVEDDSIEEPEEVPSFEPEFEAPATPEIEDVSSEVEEPESNDIDPEEGEDWEKELEKELEDELSAGEIDEFYEEETFDEFEASENTATDSNEENVIDDDLAVNTGFVQDELTENKDDYYISNIQKEEQAKAKESSEEMSDEEYAQYFGEDQKNNKANFTRTVVIGAIAFIAAGAICLLIYNSVFKDDESKKVAKVEKVVPKKAEPEPKPEPPKEDPKPKPKPKAIEQTPGEIKTLNQATGKSYIVIASFFDGDMAKDRSEQLAKQGKSPIIIPPFSDYRFYRVAIAEFNSFADAKAELAKYQGEFGQDVWPLRY
ncbi:MAG: hypothetical protein RIA69_15230 [Cyclobacteriaceae bacterium]